MTATKLSKIAKAAEVYGERSFDNYAQIRSVAEHIRDGLCLWLDNEQRCVFLVPPQGAFQAQNYQSAAFSVSGKGFLPLEPISFGLAVKISDDGDYMRLILTCRKEGGRMYVSVENSTSFTLALPLVESAMTSVYEGLYNHLVHWFTDRVEQYDHGDYGSTDIGFDIHRAED